MRDNRELITRAALFSSFLYCFMRTYFCWRPEGERQSCETPLVLALSFSLVLCYVFLKTRPEANPGVRRRALSRAQAEENRRLSANESVFTQP